MALGQLLYPTGHWPRAIDKRTAWAGAAATDNLSSIPSRYFLILDVNPNTIPPTNWLQDICEEIGRFNYDKDPWEVQTLDLVDTKSIGPQTLWFCDWGDGWSILITLDDRWTTGIGFETKWLVDLRNTDGRRFRYGSVGYRKWDSRRGRNSSNWGQNAYLNANGYYQFRGPQLQTFVSFLWPFSNYRREDFGVTWFWECSDPDIIIFPTDQGFGGGGVPSGGSRGEDPPVKSGC